MQRDHCNQHCHLFIYPNVETQVINPGTFESHVDLDSATLSKKKQNIMIPIKAANQHIDIQNIQKTIQAINEQVFDIFALNQKSHKQLEKRTQTTKELGVSSVGSCGPSSVWPI